MSTRVLTVLTALGAALPAQGSGQETSVAPERGWIGVQFDIQVTTAPRAGQESMAIFVDDVYTGGPADQGGIQPGDRLIALDGSPVVSYDMFWGFMTQLGPGQALVVRVARPEGERDVTIVAGSRPAALRAAPDVERIAVARTRLLRNIDSLLVVVATGESERTDASRGGSVSLRVTARTEIHPDSLTRMARDVEAQIRRTEGPAEGGGPALRRATVDEEVHTRLLTPYLLGGPFILGGVRARGLTTELGQYFGVASGVLITDVIGQSPAARVGFRPGDVIVSVNGARLGSVADLQAELAEVALPFELAVVRQGRTLRLRYPRQ